MLHEITDDTFDSEIVNSNVPCIIQFTAGWCTFCDDMVPRIQELDQEYAGKVKFCIVNIDQQRKLRIKFAVAAVPYIVLVMNGTKTPLFDMIVSKEQLKERIDFAINGGECPTTRPL